MCNHIQENCYRLPDGDYDCELSCDLLVAANYVLRGEAEFGDRLIISRDMLTISRLLIWKGTVAPVVDDYDPELPF